MKKARIILTCILVFSAGVSVLAVSTYKRDDPDKYLYEKVYKPLVNRDGLLFKFNGMQTEASRKNPLVYDITEGFACVEPKEVLCALVINNSSLVYLSGGLSGRPKVDVAPLSVFIALCIANQQNYTTADFEILLKRQ